MSLKLKDFDESLEGQTKSLVTISERSVLLLKALTGYEEQVYCFLLFNLKTESPIT